MRSSARPCPSPEQQGEAGLASSEIGVGRLASCPTQEGPRGPAPNLSLKLPRQSSRMSSYLFQSPTLGLLFSTPAVRGQGSSPYSPLSCCVTSASLLPSLSSRFLCPVSGMDWKLCVLLGTDLMTVSWLSVCPSGASRPGSEQEGACSIGVCGQLTRVGAGGGGWLYNRAQLQGGRRVSGLVGFGHRLTGSCASVGQMRGGG